MALSAHLTTIKTTGTSTAVVGGALSNVSGKIYRVTDSAKRVMDPATDPDVLDNGVSVADADIESIDYLTGTVTFATAYTPTTPITMSYNYLPLLTLAECREFSANFSNGLLDDTIFGDTARSRMAGIFDADGTVGSLDKALDTDIDSGGGTVTWENLLSNGAAKVLEIDPAAGSTLPFRMWVLFDSEGLAAAVDDIVNATISWKLAAQKAADGTIVSFSLAT